MSTINVLYYSNNCLTSQRLIAIMRQENILRYFTLCCIDTDRYPPEIHTTPTLLVKDIPIPYIAGDAFRYIAKLKEWKLRMLMRYATDAQKQHFSRISSNLIAEGDFIGYAKSEMGSISDSFSFYDVDIEKENKMGQLPQSYVNYNDIGKDFIETPKLENGTHRATIKKPISQETMTAFENKIRATSASQINDLERARDKQKIEFEDACDSFLGKRN